MYRVLKPGGHLMILELSSPVHFPMKQLYNIYSKVVIPTVGRLLSKEHTAYSYLPASIKVVPQGKVMTDLLSRVGFSEARSRTSPSAFVRYTRAARAVRKPPQQYKSS